jgi:hypothetical protein
MIGAMNRNLLSRFVQLRLSDSTCTDDPDSLPRIKGGVFLSTLLHKTLWLLHLAAWLAH